ncbi:MAG: ATP-grasp domain-containing protein [Peptococcaceae bacterium]|nr:ATP-grasp domain-containing protein [Peptococcaceae bacterium]
MKLFIYEYFASGAKENQELKQAGWAMLSAVCKDISLMPEFRMTTVLDSSLVDHVFPLFINKKLEIYWRRNQEDWMNLFKLALDQCDAVLIIAPETGGILAELTAIAEHYKKFVLGSSSKSLKLTCNKAEFYSLMNKQGLPVPRTEILRKPFVSDIKMNIFKKFSFPYVIKPAYGTGGQGVRLIKNKTELEDIILKLLIGEEETLLVQEYIPGQAVSVSLFVVDGKVLPLSCNQQMIENENELVIQGITTPYVHPLDQDIIKIASEACQQIPGLKGFAGVDMVVNSQGPVLMEINSRITLAYVALREVISTNIARDLLLLCREDCLPEKPELRGMYTYLL